MSDKLRLCWTIPPHVQKCREIVHAWILNSKFREIRQVHMTQLATFIDPNKYSNHKDNIKKTIIESAIVVGSTKGRLIAAIVDDENEFSELIEILLKELNIPIYRGSLNDEESINIFLENLVTSPTNNQSSVKFIRNITNEKERDLITKVKESLGIWINKNRGLYKILQDAEVDVDDYINEQKKKYCVYEEYALTKIVYSEDEKDYAHLQKFRVDILVASSSSKPLPLFVIEFDGKHHDSKDQIWKDKKRDHILLSAGLPILRISYKNDSHTSNDSFWIFMKILVARVSDVMWQRYENKRKNYLEYPLILEQIKKKHIKSGNINKKKLLADFFDLASINPAVMANEADYLHDSYDSNMEWQRLLEPDSEHAIDKIIKPPHLIGEISSEIGFHLKSTFESNGKDIDFRFPAVSEIFVTLNIPEGISDLVNVVEEAAAVAMLTDFDIEYRIKGDTPL